MSGRPIKRTLRSGPPAGTARLRRVRLHGTSESEWDMEGR